VAVVDHDGREILDDQPADRLVPRSSKATTSADLMWRLSSAPVPPTAMQYTAWCCRIASRTAGPRPPFPMMPLSPASSIGIV
jgi:hypothetical protein